MSWRETSAPTTIPFWARCDNPFHLLVLTTFLTQVSLVTIGHRAGRSSAFGLAEAELLSASFRPNGLPSRYACCVALTPLSKRNFYEVISCAVKGRTSLRTGSNGPWSMCGHFSELLRRWRGEMAISLRCSIIIGACPSVATKSGVPFITLIVMPPMEVHPHRGFLGTAFRTCLRPSWHRLMSCLVPASGGDLKR
jgi:hypothetical protein